MDYYHEAWLMVRKELRIGRRTGQQMAIHNTAHFCRECPGFRAPLVHTTMKDMEEARLAPCARCLQLYQQNRGTIVALRDVRLWRVGRKIIPI